MQIGTISQLNLIAKRYSIVEKMDKASTQNGNGGQQGQKQKGNVYRNPKDEHAKGQLINFLA